jgi:ArsR family transcriptional regulator, arsenate/arsenite/antimonite-responsive transcriptional repressor / arsenate reductase (thioredoxin)
MGSVAVPQPPLVFRLAGHPLRWRLLRELAQSDRRVRELVESMREPQSLVSYHLGRLRTAGLVAARRSSFDGRDSYYTLDLQHCGAMLIDAGYALHPALRFGPLVSAERSRSSRRRRVLFLCTGNSARSQIAEALLQHLTGNTIEAFSAGSAPKALHPNAVRVMRERGIDIAKRQPKHFDALNGQHFEYVISLCDRVREVCPEFPGRPEVIHWSIADPAAEQGGHTATYPAFKRTAAELELRIRSLLHRISDEEEAREP